MHRRITTILLLALGLAAGVGYRVATSHPLTAAEIAQRMCISDVANRASDDDQGDAVEEQVAACGIENG